MDDSHINPAQDQPVQDAQQAASGVAQSDAPAQSSTDKPPVVAVQQDTSEKTHDERGDYVTNVGGSLVDLLTDISLSETRQQKVADTMRISVEEGKALLHGLLDKIDKEELTRAELALIMTAPVADETSE